MATTEKKNTAKKTEDWNETAEVKAEPVAVAVPAPAVKKPKKPRTPLTTRLNAAPTAARRAIIIEEQLKLVDKRRAGILKLVDADTLAQVDPSLLRG